MTEADQRLQAAFAADEPPRRDLAFTVAVLAAVERRRLWARQATTGALALAAGGLLAAFAQPLGDLLGAMAPTVTVAGSVVGTVILLAFLLEQGLGARAVRP
jgi:hypothetical protein